MVCVVITTYKPDKRFLKILSGLKHQSIVPDRVLIINTEEASFTEAFTLDDVQKAFPGVEVVHIGLNEFDHGGTRNLGASLTKDADHTIFMTQDAVPADGDLVENLLKPFEDDEIAVSYARQLPAKDASPAERYTRNFNYPPEGRIKTKDDIETSGIKAFFCSDVCAAYDNRKFEKLGGFPDRAIFNEDMVYAKKALMAGYKICYASDAKVVHSHDYSALQQFKRNFDIGVSHVMEEETFGGIRSEGEGIKLVKETAHYLVKSGHILSVPRLFVLSAAKYAGYLFGRRYKRLNKKTIERFTSNKRFWINNGGF